MDNYLFIQNLNSLTKILANSSHSELQELNLVQIVGKLIRIDQTFGFDCSNEWKLILSLANENNRNQVKSNRCLFKIQLFYLVNFLFSF